MGRALERTTMGLVPLAVLVACGSSSTPPGSEPDASISAPPTDAGEAGDAAAESGDSAPQCVLVRRFGSEVCEACLRARCCEPIQACEADPDCKKLHDCVSACILKPNAAPCIQRCRQATPAGEPKFDDFDACIAALPDAPKPGCAIACSS